MIGDDIFSGLDCEPLKAALRTACPSSEFLRPGVWIEGHNSIFHSDRVKNTFSVNLENGSCQHNKNSAAEVRFLPYVGYGCRSKQKRKRY